MLVLLMAVMSVQLCGEEGTKADGWRSDVRDVRQSVFGR